MLGFAIRVESASHDPNVLEERADAFFRDFVATLGDMSAEDFEKHKQALIAVKLTKPNNLIEEAMEYWDPVRIAFLLVVLFFLSFFFADRLAHAASSASSSSTKAADR